MWVYSPVKLIHRVILASSTTLLTLATPDVLVGSVQWYAVLQTPCLLTDLVIPTSNFANLLLTGNMRIRDKFQLTAAFSCTLSGALCADDSCV